MCTKPYTKKTYSKAKALEHIALGLSSGFRLEPVDRLELTTCCLQNSCSTN